MLAALSQLAQTYDYTYTTSPSSSIFGGTFVLVWLALAVIGIVAMAKLFMKANRQWWEAIIPFYNTYVLLQIVGRPGWWFLLFLIPFVNIVIAIIVYIDLAKSFGKDVGWGILTILFPYIMYPIMAFSKNIHYTGPAAKKGSGGSPNTPSTPAGPTPTSTDPTAPQPPVNSEPPAEAPAPPKSTGPDSPIS